VALHPVALHPVALHPVALHPVALHPVALHTPLKYFVEEDSEVVAPEIVAVVSQVDTEASVADYENHFDLG